MTPVRSTPIPVAFLAVASREVAPYRALPDLEQEYKELQALYAAAVVTTQTTRAAARLHAQEAGRDQRD